MPESAIYDESQDRIIVSVIGGHPGEVDGDGRLVVLSPDGQTIDAGWVSGLDAPKGLAIIGNTLLVADLKKLHVIDLQSGARKNSIEKEAAVFFNDISVDGEIAYVTDFMANKIWQYKDGDLSIWLESAELNHPNGILLDNDRLLVGSWGEGMKADFTTDTPGSLLSIDIAPGEIETVAEEVGNLDGIVMIENTIYVSDWITGQLFSISDEPAARLVDTFPAGLADIAHHGKTLLLPAMLEGTISAYSLTQ